MGSGSQRDRVVEGSSWALGPSKPVILNESPGLHVADRSA